MAIATLIASGVSLISGAAKNFFNGDARAARKAKRQAKKEAKNAAKQAKEQAKAILTGSSTAGTQFGTFMVKAKTWFLANWQIIAVVVGAIIAIWFLFFRKKTGGVRRRSGSRKGSSSMKTRMAKVRAARKKKRK